MTGQEQLQELREYGTNPIIKELNAEARKSKRGKPLRRPRRPEQIEPGYLIKWLEHNGNRGNAVWRERSGRVVSITNKFIVIDFGKYLGTILLANLHIGSARLI